MRKRKTVAITLLPRDAALLERMVEWQKRPRGEVISALLHEANAIRSYMWEPIRKMDRTNPGRACEYRIWEMEHLPTEIPRPRELLDYRPSGSVQAVSHGQAAALYARGAGERRPRDVVVQRVHTLHTKRVQISLKPTWRAIEIPKETA